MSQWFMDRSYGQWLDAIRLRLVSLTTEDFLTATPLRVNAYKAMRELRAVESSELFQNIPATNNRNCPHARSNDRLIMWKE